MNWKTSIAALLIGGVLSVEAERRHNVRTTRPTGRTMPLHRQLGKMAWLRVRHPTADLILVGHKYVGHGLRIQGMRNAYIVDCTVIYAPSDGFLVTP